MSRSALEASMELVDFCFAWFLSLYALIITAFALTTRPSQTMVTLLKAGPPSDAMFVTQIEVRLSQTNYGAIPVFWNFAINLFSYNVSK